MKKFIYLVQYGLSGCYMPNDVQAYQYFDDAMSSVIDALELDRADVKILRRDRRIDAYVEYGDTDSATIVRMSTADPIAKDWIKDLRQEGNWID